MSRLYACIISGSAKKDEAVLVSVALAFSSCIETLEDGVLFDVSGLENLMGDARRIEQKIKRQLDANCISGNVAIAENTNAAILLARQAQPLDPESSTDKFSQISLHDLGIEQTLNIFDELGIHKIRDLQRIPADELIRRYGQEFRNIIDVIEQKSSCLLTPNIKETSAWWTYKLDFPIDDFEQLIFVVNHGLGKLMTETAYHGKSIEQIDISLELEKKTKKFYEVKTSFPTLERAFWLKLINLRISLEPPESEIVSIDLISHFTKPRPTQKGLYAVSRPEPESLLLTINKLKKLVGEDDVGVPMLLDQRLSEAYTLAAEKSPSGKEVIEFRSPNSVVALSYFDPPIPAKVFVNDKRLVFIKAPNFKGRVKKYSGVWKANSSWWNRFWEKREWDVEMENQGLYRLQKIERDWFLAGEYD
ncbi:MAG: hypothetical protein ABR535_00140 [Pyrinomonadaceae bacterium]